MHPAMHATADAQSTLHALLDDQAAYAPEYRGGLSNHGPMLLHALHALGAPPERLRGFAALYNRRLERQPASHVDPAALASTPTDWPAGLGRLDRFEATRAAFGAWLARDGTTATLRAALPVLMPGVAAGAFHGLLRTAHALEAGHAAELAAGLAYWAAVHQPLLPADAALPPGTRSLADWLDGVLALPAPQDAEAPLISLRMAAWARAPGFAGAATALQVDDAAATLAALARWAALAYAATGSFTVLHVVTSCQAMRTLLPLQADAAAAVRYYAVAVAAGLRAARLDAATVARLAADAVAAAPWDAIVPPAIASDDDHIAKLVYACRRLDDALSIDPGDNVFRRAAHRAVQADGSRATAPATAGHATPETTP